MKTGTVTNGTHEGETVHQSIILGQQGRWYSDYTCKHLISDVTNDDVHITRIGKHALEFQENRR